MNLEAVFRLAEERNAQIALAREKVHESQIENDLAAKGWMPKVTAGVGYYRHEGGIQNEDGTLTRSSFGALYPGVDLHTPSTCARPPSPASTPSASAGSSRAS